MFTKATNLAKQAIKAIIDLTIIVKKKQLEKYSIKPKTNKKCFNYRKTSYYTRNCNMLNKKKPKELLKKAKCIYKMKNQAKATAGRSTINYNNSNAKLFCKIVNLVLAKLLD